jgi:NADH:ubiquinone oxidoreductase subunit F (NADH-binding)/(2Fe-2S) ferredoxin/Pyruvate/2-oxoacid:ferredoxin oxidoreductase delta subunit
MTSESVTEEKRTILVCLGTGCVSSNSPQIYDGLAEELKKHDLADTIELKFTGCHGFCQRGPIVIVEPEGIFYSEVKVKDAAEIIDSHIINGKPVERLFYHDPQTDLPVPHYRDIGFYKHQDRSVVLRNCGHIDPENIDNYLKVGGYEALKKVLDEMTPEQVIEEITNSGLRGRGGAGFPAGVKWKFCRAAKGEPKYIICNGDEGDPGAFMDRSTLEADPHTVLEGMIIAGYAIGASHGYIYVRAEYPLAVKRFRKALDQAEELGFLGSNIMGSSYSLKIEVKEGAGAFVCGEETALMESIMGRRGMPRPRPPFPAEVGVWGKPTIINNVKTLASVPVIISNGAEWFASIGTENSSGTAVFALTGKIENSGLVEVPMGATFRQIIFDIGGGIPDGREFKAVQTGGPSGGCLPASFVDSAIDFKTLTAAGSIMGSGGMIVMDDTTCMVDIAHYFLSFTQEESCGKCTPCRIGTRLMLDILARIKSGDGMEDDMDMLKDLATTIQNASLCGLGQTAPNPVLTTLRYFRDEYKEHIIHKRCPALSCKDLIEYHIDPDICIGCLLCKKNCPSEAISGESKKVHVIDTAKCIKCGICFQVCPAKVDAVYKTSGGRS